MKKFTKFSTLALSAAMAFTSVFGGTVALKAAEPFTGSLASVDSAKASGNIVNVSFNGGAVNAKITFLEGDIFRYNVDPSGTFAEYADPGYAGYTGKIQAQPDNSDHYSKPAASVKETETAFEIGTEGGATIVLEKATAKMSIKNASGEVVMSEKEALTIGSKTVQKLNTNDTEYFFGGGTQNGRFTHKGQSINIKNESSWTDGGVASPNPFYWSNAGYGVIRNTFKQGVYDFGSVDSSTVNTTHNDAEFDAYFLVSDEDGVTATANELLNNYYHVTGNPALLPEYAFYLAHLNCYNRDGWQESTNGRGWVLEDGKLYNELGMGTGYVLPQGTYAETLNNIAPTVDASLFKGVINEDTYKFSARAVIDGHVANDMPLGWFLPNDGYGCGYGHNGYYQKSNTTLSDRETVINANVENLTQFTEYAESLGVRTGLWTQAALTPDQSEVDGGYKGYQTLRDFQKEVTVGGVSALKTDVAWVGAGYSMGLNSVKDGYNILATSDKRPTLVSLDGWAGTQRYASIWTGDQTGGNWEYIRFHIPTYIGQSLAGNPNIGSDVDGIFGGSALITTRDIQAKAFIQTMLDMDGWGSKPKKPYIDGDPYESINRMYLKLKAQLMPYLYTYAIDSVDGLPMIRAMFLEEENEYTYSTATQYQFMYGDSFLVAPIYQDTAMDENGNDIRNNIYLPSTADTWIDYWTGEHYKGGQIVNNFDAPLWKLPLFVKNGSIIPMYEENNNPMEVSETNEKGLDKSRRIVEFYPYGETSFDLVEDDGITLEFNADTNSRDYGGRVTTQFTSVVKGDVATLTAGKSSGTYDGYESKRHSTFVVNVTKKPTSLSAKNGSENLALVEVDSYEAFEAAAANNQAVWFYDEAPNLNKYSADDEAFKDVAITTSPKVYVSFTKTDVNKNAQTLVIEGFENATNLPADKENSALSAPANLAAAEETKTPTSILLTWDAVEGATGYEMMVDGILYNVGNETAFNHSELAYHSTHTYKIRAINADGFSAWSDEMESTSLDDPWKDTPKPQSVNWEGGIYGGYVADKAFNNEFEAEQGFHSGGNDMGKALVLDYGLGYQFEKFEYYPRPDAGNGTVTRMTVTTSLDGVHWTDPINVTWARDNSMKTVQLNQKARFVKMVPTEAVGNFFSAIEIKMYKVADTRGFAIGSIAPWGNPAPTDADYTNLDNYKGLSKLDNPTFDTQIENYGVDINMNGIYDVYDYAFTMFKLDGGTKQTGSVAGNAILLASKTAVAEGETFTVDVYADNVKNLNAIGQVIGYNSNKAEFIKVQQSARILGMTNLSVNKVYDDANASYFNLAFVNRGNLKTFSGSGILASITFKAKEDITVADVVDLSKVTLMGPDYSTVVTTAAGAEVPEIPSVSVTNYGRNDFNITMTNDVLTTDSGNNVEKFIQGGSQASYDMLFNGEFGREFEFLWDIDANYVDGAMPAHITLPLTMTFDLKQNDGLNIVKVYNSNKGNGYVTSVKAVIKYADGTTAEDTKSIEAAAGGNQAFEFKFDETKAVDKVDVVILKAITSQGADAKDMMTLAEVEFAKESSVPVTGIELGQNETEFYTNALVDVNATVLPNNATNGYYTATSSDEEIVSVIPLAWADGVSSIKLRGNKAGTATITVKALGNEEITATYNVTVIDGVNTASLEAALAKAANCTDQTYTGGSLAALEEVVVAAKALLDSGEYTEFDIEKMAADLEAAIEALEYLPLNDAGLINTSADTNIKVIGFSSECETSKIEPGEAVNTLDYDDATHWHTNYNTDLYMPQYIDYDLGEAYTLTDVTFLPRQNGTNGDITRAEVLVKVNEGDEWTSVGEYSFANEDGLLLNRTSFKRMGFAPVSARYVRVNVLNATGTQVDKFASMAEIRFYQAAARKEAPAKVENVKLTQKDYKTINVKWDAVEGAEAYEVYSKTADGSYKLTATVDTNAAKITVKTGKKYSVRVLAVVYDGDEALKGDFSETKDFATQLEGKPELAIEKVSTAKFKLKWTSIDGATRYIIYRKRNDDKMKKVLTLGSKDLEYTTAELPYGDYEFVVRAGRYDSKDRVMTDGSNKVTGTVEKLAPSIKATAGTKSVKVTWSKMEGVTHYQVYRATSSTGKYTKLTTTTSTSYTAKSLTKGKKYYFKVRGYKTYKSGDDVKYTVYTPYSKVKYATAK